MIRFIMLLTAGLFLSACNDETPRATSEVSPDGRPFTLVTLPGNEDVSIHIAWATDWGYRSDTNKAAPVIGAELILAGGAEGFPAGEAGERFADLSSEGLIYASVNDHIIGELTFPTSARDEVIEIANAHLLTPTLDEIWFERIRDGIAQNMAEAQAQPAHAGFDATRWAIFGDAPLRNALSLDDDGTFEELTRDDIVLWHAATFTSAPEAIVVAGDISNSDAGAAIDTLLAGLPDPQPMQVNATEPDFSPRRILLHMPDAEVTTLSLIAPLPPTKDGGEFEDLILIHALGGDDQSVLFDAVRTQLRASYAFGTGVANYTRDKRILVMTGEVDPDKVAQAEAIIREAYDTFRAEGLSGSLEDRKAPFAANFADLSDFVVDQARSELQSALDNYAPGRSLALSNELEAVSDATVSARLTDAFPMADDFLVIAVSPDPAALPDACVIEEPGQAQFCQ